MLVLFAYIVYLALNIQMTPELNDLRTMTGASILPFTLTYVDKGGFSSTDSMTAPVISGPWPLHLTLDTDTHATLLPVKKAGDMTFAEAKRYYDYAHPMRESNISPEERRRLLGKEMYDLPRGGRQ